MIKVYNKLVRDRIPEIIEADGKKCKIENLSDDDYLEITYIVLHIYGMYI